MASRDSNILFPVYAFGSSRRSLPSTQIWTAHSKQGQWVGYRRKLCTSWIRVRRSLVVCGQFNLPCLLDMPYGSILEHRSCRVCRDKVCTTYRSEICHPNRYSPLNSLLSSLSKIQSRSLQPFCIALCILHSTMDSWVRIWTLWAGAQNFRNEISFWTPSTK